MAYSLGSSEKSAVETYANLKSVATSFAAASGLTANVALLRHVLDSGVADKYYQTNLGLVSVALILAGVTMALQLAMYFFNVLEPGIYLEEVSASAARNTVEAFASLAQLTTNSVPNPGAVVTAAELDEWIALAKINEFNAFQNIHNSGDGYVGRPLLLTNELSAHNTLFVDLEPLRQALPTYTILLQFAQVIVATAGHILTDANALGIQARGGNGVGLPQPALPKQALFFSSPQPTTQLWKEKIVLIQFAILVLAVCASVIDLFIASFTGSSSNPIVIYPNGTIIS